jgi:hypothetical protein
MIDGPGDKPRGGAPLETAASATGREKTCKLPNIKTIANADVRFATLDGVPIQGTRSDSKGRLHLTGLIGPKKGQTIMMTANDGRKADAQLVTLGG